MNTRLGRASWHLFAVTFLNMCWYFWLLHKEGKSMNLARGWRSLQHYDTEHQPRRKCHAPMQEVWAAKEKYCFAVDAKFLVSSFWFLVSQATKSSPYVTISLLGTVSRRLNPFFKLQCLTTQSNPRLGLNHQRFPHSACKIRCKWSHEFLSDKSYTLVCLACMACLITRWQERIHYEPKPTAFGIVLYRYCYVFNL